VAKHPGVWGLPYPTSNPRDQNDTKTHPQFRLIPRDASIAPPRGRQCPTCGAENGGLLRRQSRASEPSIPRTSPPPDPKGCRSRTLGHHHSLGRSTFSAHRDVSPTARQHAPPTSAAASPSLTAIDTDQPQSRKKRPAWTDGKPLPKAEVDTTKIQPRAEARKIQKPNDRVYNCSQWI